MLAQEAREVPRQGFYRDVGGVLLGLVYGRDELFRGGSRSDEGCRAFEKLGLLFVDAVEPAREAAEETLQADEGLLLEQRIVLGPRCVLALGFLDLFVVLSRAIDRGLPVCLPIEGLLRLLSLYQRRGLDEADGRESLAGLQIEDILSRRGQVDE